MAKGVLYKFNATARSHSQSKKMNATTTTQGKIRHADATTWFDNFPMFTEQTKTFSATWSQGWRGDGVKLDATAWSDNVLSGGADDFQGMFGFNQSAIADFIAGGTVTKVILRLNCYETSASGSPDVHIGKHTYASEPLGNWTGQNASWYDYVNLHINNKAVGGYSITLKNSQIKYNGVVIGGVALRGATATGEDMGKFNGISTYDTRLEITVLK